MAATTVTPTAVRILLTSLNMTSAQLETILDYKTSGAKAARFHDYFGGGLRRNYPQKWSINVGAAFASATLTISSTGPTNNQNVVIAGVTFTFKTSGATGNQSNLGASVTATAANLVAAVNASASTNTMVLASNLAGVVTIKAAVPGLIGNFVTLTAGTASNTVASAGTLSAGAEGDGYTIDLS